MGFELAVLVVIGRPEEGGFVANTISPAGRGGKWKVEGERWQALFIHQKQALLPGFDTNCAL